MRRCGRCSAIVVEDEVAVDRPGGSVREVVNPEGFRFVIECVAGPPRARPEGVPSGHWSWFPGYRWRRLRCCSCEAHVGWVFESRDDAFVALRRDATTGTPPDS